MLDLDQAIDLSYREEFDVEAASRNLEARIEQIPGTKVLLPSRKYGTLELQEIQENLTLASLISRSDAALADYYGLKASVKHRIDKQREVQKMRAEPLRIQTGKLAARNQQAKTVKRGKPFSLPTRLSELLMLNRPHPCLGWL